MTGESRARRDMVACLAAPSRQQGSLRRLASEFSPRFEWHERGFVVMDVGGLGHLHGDAHAIGRVLRQAAARRQMTIRVALAATRVAAVLMASARDGVSIVPHGTEAATLTSLSLVHLEMLLAGAIRLGLRYVTGLREHVGRVMARPFLDSSRQHREPAACPKCGCDDRSMLEVVMATSRGQACFCSMCAHDWEMVIPAPAVELEPERRYVSLEQLIARTGVHRNELATLTEIGALRAFGKDRRSALWQIERAVRPTGRLFETRDDEVEMAKPMGLPLDPMTPVERVIADYAGTGLTVGPHPMALRRADLALRGVLRSADLVDARHGRRVRIAGAVITRQRPGTAKGFVFLTLEDEAGIINIIVRPDLFDRERVTIVEEPFLLIEEILHVQDGVTSVKAERIAGLPGATPDVSSHDFNRSSASRAPGRRASGPQPSADSDARSCRGRPSAPIGRSPDSAVPTRPARAA